jgi:hypothetical protein
MAYAQANETYPVPKYAPAPVKPPMPTLTRAITSMDDLNKRLSGLHIQAEQLAMSIGGPFPAHDKADEAATPESAVHRLNEEVDEAHRRVTALEGCIGAMARALGS